MSEMAQERSGYAELLHRELGWLDQRVLELQNESARVSGAAKEKKERDLSTARTFRARLRDELDELERVDDGEWTRLRERIDHDLEDGWPPSLSRYSEKSLAI